MSGDRPSSGGPRRRALLAGLGLLPGLAALTAGLLVLFLGSVATTSAPGFGSMRLATAAAILVLGACALLGAGWIDARLSRPLRRLTESARRIAEGDLEHPIDEAAGDDVRLLSEALRGMADSLRRTVDGLKRSDEHLRAILDGTADGIVLIDPGDGKIIEANRRLGQIAGRDRRDLVGTRFGDFATGLEGPTLSDVARRLSADEETPAWTGLLTRPDGTEIKVETTASRLVSQGRNLLLLVVRDVSDRVALEEEIRHHNERLRHLFGVATRLRGTRDVDEQARIIVEGVRDAGWSRAAFYLYGEGWTLERMAFAGFTESEQKILRAKAMSPEDRRRLFESVLPEYRIGNCFFIPGDQPGALEVLPTVIPSAIPESESRGWHPDDSLLIPLEGRDGRILASLSVDDPLDRRRPTPDSLRILELFAAAAAATIEEDRVHGQMVRTERLKALGEMAGGVAHDFNNVLGAILGRSQLMMAGTDDPELLRSLRVIEKAARDGAQTVKRIQEFTRVRRDHALVPTDLSALIEDTIEITRSRWRDEAEADGVRFEIATDVPRGLQVVGSASELREVFTNLLLNAFDAMPRGGRLAIVASSEGGRIRIAITDTGLGMTEEVRSRVFDPFFTTKGVRGTGLGLSVSYGIVRRHGGDILVESEFGRGTTFTVLLPEGSGPLGAPGVETAGPNERGRVLAVDDEEHVRALVEEILRIQGHEVFVARDGEEGIRLLSSEGPFDVVLTDLGMPGISGWEVARRIRQHSPATRVILLTGWGGTLVPRDLESTGVARILNKPFEMRELLAAVDEQIRLYRAKASPADTRV